MIQSAAILRSECLFLKKKKKWIAGQVTMERVNGGEMVRMKVEKKLEKKSERRWKSFDPPQTTTLVDHNILHYIGHIAGESKKAMRPTLTVAFSTGTITVAFGSLKILDAWVKVLTRTYGNGAGFLVDYEKSLKKLEKRSGKQLNHVLFVKSLSFGIISWEMRDLVVTGSLYDVQRITCSSGLVSMVTQNGSSLYFGCPDESRLCAVFRAIQKEHNLPLSLNRSLNASASIQIPYTPLSKDVAKRREDRARKGDGYEMTPHRVDCVAQSSARRRLPSTPLLSPVPNLQPSMPTYISLLSPTRHVTQNDHEADVTVFHSLPSSPIDPPAPKTPIDSNPEAIPRFALQFAAFTI
ncbi:unnamed protein product, partial [Mesorhabditis belari]|uniref:Uncharacterized protein n=1 Tax=Mesorhabditis belari TaxID=2138241 RepID=A0AAF3FHM2_9BILA